MNDKDSQNQSAGEAANQDQQISPIDLSWPSVNTSTSIEVQRLDIEKAENTESLSTKEEK